MGLKSHSNSIAIPNSFSSKDEVTAIAQKIAAQPAYISRPGVWGVLTAISDKARKRLQGLDILMHGDEHILGRTVKETRCQFESPNVSGRHCRVYRKKVVLENAEQSTGTCYFVFLKDSSSNGTYLNWEKLKKDSPEAQIQHGDIISLVNPPEHENAFAFVFREIRQDLSCCRQQDSVSNISAKRKVPIADIFGENFVGDGKRIKALGIVGPAGPVSFHDVRILQQSNEDLCQQLEAHVLTIEKLHAESQGTPARHDKELKKLRESITVSFLEEIKEIRHELATKEKELKETVAISTWQQNCIEDLNQQLAAATQSQTDLEEIIQNQTAAITELEKQLVEERSQWRDEKEKAESLLKAAVERVLAESFEELKQQSEAAAWQQKEQLVVINKLQAAQEDAWAKVSSLELELAAAIRDLGLERQQLQCARERFVLRETRLQAFHSAAEEIAALQRKQQEQLHGMFIILEDGENCKFTNTNNDFETRTENLCRKVTRAREEIMAGNIETRRIQWEEAAETPKTVRETDRADDSGGVEKCNMNKTKLGDALNDWENVDTQGEDCANILCSMRNHDRDHIGTEQVLGTEAEATQLLESRNGGRRIEFRTYAIGSEPARTSENVRERILEDGEGGLGELEDNCQAPTDWERTDLACENRATLHTRDGAEPERLPDMDNNGQYLTRTSHPFENLLNQDGHSPFPVNPQCRDKMDSRNKEEEHTVATIDLLTSEVAGSWAVSTVGSVRGDNESLRSDDRQPGTGSISDEGINQDFDASQAAASNNLGAGQDSHSLKCQDTQPGKMMQCEDKCQAPTDWGTDLAGENRATLHTMSGAEPERLPDMDNNGQYLTRTSHPFENSLNQERQSPFPVNQQCRDEMDSGNKEEEHTVATIDLLTSEVAGSWAVSTVGSVHGDNESLQSDDRQPGTGRVSDEGINQDFDASQAAGSNNLRSRQDSCRLKCQDTQPEDATAGSQNSPVPRLATRQRYEHQALNEMLDIVDPDFKQLHGPRGNNDNARCQRIYRRGRNKNHNDDDTEEDSGGPES